MTKLSLGGRLLRSSSAATVSQVWRVGVMFVTQAILRRLVAPDDWGYWHWAVDFLFVILGQARDLGLPAQVVRDPQRPYGAFLAVEAGWGALLSLALVVGAPVLAWMSPESSLHAVPLLQALVLFFFFEGLAKVPMTYFEAEIRVERTLWPEIVRNLVYVVISLWLAAEGHGIWSLLVAHVAAAAVFAGMLWWRAWGEMPLTWTQGSAGPLLRSSLPLMLMAMVLLAIETVDYQVIALRFDDRVLGLYGGALTLALMVTRVVEWPLRRALYPTFVEVRDDPKRFFETYRLSTILLLAIHVPVAGVLYVNASTVLGLVWGEDYHAAAGFLELLALVPLVQPFARCAEDVLLPRHEERILTTSAVINLMALVGLGYWLTGVLGPEGMAWAKLAPVGAALIIWAMARVDIAGFRRLGWNVLAMYVVGVALFGAAAWIGGGEGYLRLGLSLLAGVLTFFVYAGMFGKAFREFFLGEPERGTD